MIEVKELYKSFEGFQALNGLNLHTPRGAVYGLVGPNGAGKSTLIRHLAGIYRQDRGDVKIAGEPVFDNPKAAWPTFRMRSSILHSPAFWT